MTTLQESGVEYDHKKKNVTSYIETELNQIPEQY